MLAAPQVKRLEVLIASFDNDCLCKIFYALGDPTRFAIVRLLLEQQELCVTDIARVLRLSNAAASHQCKLLEIVGILKRIRMGRMVCYKIKREDEAIAAILHMFRKHHAC